MKPIVRIPLVITETFTGHQTEGVLVGVMVKDLDLLEAELRRAVATNPEVLDPDIETKRLLFEEAVRGQLVEFGMPLGSADLLTGVIVAIAREHLP